MEGGTTVYRVEHTNIEVAEHSLGAYTGEWPTILVAALAGIGGGLLSSIGKEIWETLKSFLQQRFRALEAHRKANERIRKERRRVFKVYIVSEVEGVPIVYYASPAQDYLPLDFDPEVLRVAEAEIRILIRARNSDERSFWAST